MLRVLLAALLALAFILPIAATAAEDQRTELVQKLYELSQDVLSQTIVPVRGGSKDKSLGVYLGTKDDIEFRSGYKNVEPRTQCEWAYDLHQFIVQNGGGYHNPPNTPNTCWVCLGGFGLLNSSLAGAAGGKDPKDAWDRAHVPYDKQAAFADKWWKNNSQAYTKSVVPPKDWWTHDAVLDGNNLWTRYEMINGKFGSDFLGWRDSELAKLLKKQ